MTILVLVSPHQPLSYPAPSHFTNISFSTPHSRLTNQTIDFYSKRTPSSQIIPPPPSLPLIVINLRLTTQAITSTNTVTSKHHVESRTAQYLIPLRLLPFQFLQRHLVLHLKRIASAQNGLDRFRVEQVLLERLRQLRLCLLDLGHRSVCSLLLKVTCTFD